MTHGANAAGAATPQQAGSAVAAGKQAQIPVGKKVQLLRSRHRHNKATAAGNGMTAIEQNGSLDEEINELLTYYCAAAVRTAKADDDADDTISIDEGTPAAKQRRPNG